MRQSRWDLFCAYIRNDVCILHIISGSGRAAGYPCYEDDILYEYCWLHYGILIGKYRRVCASYECKRMDRSICSLSWRSYLSEWVFFQYGVQYVGAQDAAILSTFEPVTSMIVGILVLHESASLSSMAGCILILISVTATAFAKS